MQMASPWVAYVLSTTSVSLAPGRLQQGRRAAFSRPPKGCGRLATCAGQNRHNKRPRRKIPAPIMGGPALLRPIPIISVAVCGLEQETKTAGGEEAIATLPS